MEPSRRRSSTDRHFPASSDAGVAKAPRRQAIMWKVVVGSVLALIAVTLVILWPVFKAAGAAVGTGMALAIVVLSLTPLLLLGATLRRTSASQVTDDSNAAEAERER